MNYIYIEYPKALYKGTIDNWETITVHSLEEAAPAIQDGWSTAETFFTQQAEAKPKKGRK